jgi:hypothetical protein
MLSLSGSIEILGPAGEQLPLDLRHVPNVDLVFSIIFFASGSLFMFVAGTASHRPSKPVHMIIALTTLLQGVTLLLEWNTLFHVKTHGKESLLGSVVTQCVGLIHGISELMMLILIAFGWRLLRQHLNPTEVRFVIGTFAFSLYLGVFEVAGTSAAACNNYKLSRYILQVLCYIMVIIAMNVNLHMMRQQLEASPASIETGNIYIKFRAYSAFRWVVLAFVLVPTFKIAIISCVSPWDAMWAYVWLRNLSTLILYWVIALYFRPRPKPLRIFELARDAWSEDGEVEGTE